MTNRLVTLGRWVRATALLAAPAAVVFVILSVLDIVSPLTAALAWLAICTTSALIVFPLLDDLERLRRLVETKQTALPMFGRWPARDAVAAVLRDKRRAAEQVATLEAERAELERAFDALPDPLLLLDAERKIVRANRAALTLLGEDLVGRDIAGSLRNPRLLQAIEGALSDAWDQEVEIKISAPVERIFASRIERLPEPGRHGEKILLALIDLTAVRRTEQMRADFVANASHEIRTPLSTLIGFIETLRGAAKDDADARQRFLAIMDQHAQRMHRLVEDLLSLSRIEINEHTPPTARVGVEAILAAVRNNLAWQAKAREVTITVDTGQDLPEVIGDAEELTQVFLNLVDNAIKYGPTRGEVVMRARLVSEPPGVVGWAASEHGAVAVAVIDQGDGISRDQLPRLTERFYRVDTARSRELGGTGLGLAIVKHIVNRHRGALAIDSAPDEGSTFTVYLQPAHETEQRPPRSVA